MLRSSKGSVKTRPAGRAQPGEIATTIPGELSSYGDDANLVDRAAKDSDGVLMYS